MTATDVLVEAIADAVYKRISSLIPAGGEQRLMPIPEAAKYLGRTGASLRGLIANGEIPQACVKRVGSRVFLAKRELDQWIAAQ